MVHRSLLSEVELALTQLEEELFFDESPRRRVRAGGAKHQGVVEFLGKGDAAVEDLGHLPHDFAVVRDRSIVAAELLLAPGERADDRINDGLRAFVPREVARDSGVPTKGSLAC